MGYVWTKIVGEGISPEVFGDANGDPFETAEAATEAAEAYAENPESGDVFGGVEILPSPS